MFLHTGYCGMDTVEFVEFDEKPSEEELNDICWQLAVENAERFGIYPECYREEYGDSEDDEEGSEYSDNIEGYAEEYDPEKHDKYSIGLTVSFNKYY